MPADTPTLNRAANQMAQTLTEVTLPPLTEEQRARIGESVFSAEEMAAAAAREEYYRTGWKRPPVETDGAAARKERARG